MSYIEWIRGLVGKRRIFLAFASVVLFNEEGGILLQQRTDFDAWGLPGGILEPGEDLLSCARRELFEESGLTAGELSLVGVYAGPAYESTYPNGDQVQPVITIFLAHPVGGSLRADGDETSEVTWMPLEGVAQLQLDPSLKSLQEALLGHLEGGYFIEAG